MLYNTNWVPTAPRGNKRCAASQSQPGKHCVTFAGHHLSCWDLGVSGEALAEPLVAPRGFLLTFFPSSPCRTSKRQCWPHRREAEMQSHVGSKLMWHPSHQLFLRLPTRFNTAAQCIPTWRRRLRTHTCPASHICTLMLQLLLQRWAPPPPSPISSPLRAPHGTPSTLPTPAHSSTRSL